jgi:hypothetical protein
VISNDKQERIRGALDERAAEGTALHELAIRVRLGKSRRSESVKC